MRIPSLVGHHYERPNSSSRGLLTTRKRSWRFTSPMRRNRIIWIVTVSRVVPIRAGDGGESPLLLGEEELSKDRVLIEDVHDRFRPFVRGGENSHLSVFDDVESAARVAFGEDRGALPVQSLCAPASAPPLQERSFLYHDPSKWKEFKSGEKGDHIPHGPPSSLPDAGIYPYALCVGTKAALILGGGGITGGMYELGALSAMDDFIVSGRKSGEFDLYVGISAGSILAAFLANGITVNEMSSAVLGEGTEGIFLRREDIFELPIRNLFRFLGRSVRNLGTVVRHIRKNGQSVTFLNILAVLQQFLPAGFFSNANLERYVGRALSGEGRTNDFRAIRKPLAIVATEVDTGERWIFGEGGRKDIPISKAIQASTAIPVFFEPVLIEDRFFVDGAAERVGHLDIAAAAGADLIVMINPIVPIYNDRSVVCIPTLDGQCGSLTERGVTADRGADVPDQLEGQARAGGSPFPRRPSRDGFPHDRAVTGGIVPVSLREHELRGTRSFPELWLQLLRVLLHRKFRYVAGTLRPARNGSFPGATRRRPVSPTGRDPPGPASVRTHKQK